EGETLKAAIELARKNNNKLHVCHVSKASEISLIRQAKDQGLSITCEVTAHHLFLTENDAKRLGSFGMMRPPLENPDVLWEAIKDQTIDMIASDHAPHTKEEKLSPNPPNGVPGLETTLPLLLTAVSEGKITIEDIIRLCHTNPAKIFNIPMQPDTYIEIDPAVSYSLSPDALFTKSQWTPFEGMKVVGKIKRVVLRGKTVFKDGEIIGNPQGNTIAQNGSY
ncbi:MAG: amidohydrolase family protein, partial [Candidatus Daviesbacteria bacterium]|nr:amidohydrolase family protein [Candidatus Daviesbacteria bacterium]